MTGGPEKGNPFRSRMSGSLGSLETTASYANSYSIMTGQERKGKEPKKKELIRRWNERKKK